MIWASLRRMHRAFLLILLFLCTGAVAQSVELDSVRFKNFSIGDGLSQVTVRAIAQDDAGFIWLGTQDGLNRYDGYRFESFYAGSAAQFALSDSHILALANDSARDGMWIGTQAGGLNFLDLRTQQFRRFNLQLPNVSDQLLAEVSCIHLAVDHQLWVGTGAGLVRMDVENGRVAQFWPMSGALSLAQRGDEIFVGTRNGAFVLRNGVDLAKATPRRFVDGPMGEGSFNAIAVAPDQSVWLGTERNGVVHVAPDGTRVDVALNAVLPGPDVRSLLITNAGELWVGTVSGAVLLQTGGADPLVFTHDASAGGSLAANRTVALFQDSEARFWIGSWTAGVSMHDPRTRAISVVHSGKNGKSAPPPGPVRSIWQDDDGSYWIGVQEGGGLVHMSPDNQMLARYVHDANDPKTLGNTAILALMRRKNGELWVSTSGAGLNVLRADGSFRHVSPLPNADELFPSLSVYALTEDARGTLWLGTDDHGVWQRCTDCQSFTALSLPEGQQFPQAINVVFAAPDGLIWVGAQGGGLMVVDPVSKRVRRFRAEPGNANALSHDSVTDVLRSKNGTMWIATQGGGINRLELHGSDILKDAARFHATSKRDGLGADAVGAIAEDARGQIWISTTVGISVLDPISNKVRNLTESDGLERGGFFIGAKAISPSGRVRFGGLRGLLQFDPLDLADTLPPPSAHITGLRISNVLQSLQWQDAGSPLQMAPARTNTLLLTPKQSTISIEFSSLQFGRIRDARYRYQLLGASNEWTTTTEGQNSATFSNLPAGSYEFLVRAADASTGEFGKVRKLSLRVKQPPWLTWQAKLIYAGALLSLLVLWFRWRARRTHRDQESLARITSSEDKLKSALWGSRDELWDVDFETGIYSSQNPLPFRAGSVHKPKFNCVEDLLVLAHTDDQPSLRERLNEHVENRSDYYEAAFRIRDLQGGWSWVLSRGRATKRDANGRAVRLAGTLRDISALKRVEDQLRAANESLESRVEQRTEDLQASNRDLSTALDALRRAQDQLVENEKMASLGNLVAGVAHEINTPLGIGVTAASHLRMEAERLNISMQRGNLTKQDIEQFTQVAVESSDLVLRNLDRASKLVKSFKQVAVDQSSEERRVIFLRSYIEEVLIALKPTLRRTAHEVRVDIPADISLDTFPGALSQIVFNLVTNSLTHAFTGEENGLMEFSAKVANQTLELRYRDTGSGMSEEVRRRVFEPFFTTKRGQGGSGLGMNVVYNLVTQLMGGTIACESAPKVGVEFVMRFPWRSRSVAN
jgi:ligand-binding sensor domain-containing protein/signal transduction histidine kinase